MRMNVMRRNDDAMKTNVCNQKISLFIQVKEYLAAREEYLHAHF